MPSIGTHLYVPGRTHRLLSLPHEPVCMCIGGQRMGKVGIFWFYEGTPLLVAVPLQHGLDDGDCINGPDDHLPAWARVRRAVPALRTMKYNEGAHGRIIYKNAEGQTWTAYM